MKPAIAVIVLALFSAIGTVAQTAPVKVFVFSEPNTESQEIAARLAGKIGSTSRYALRSTGVGARLMVDVACLNVVINGSKTGIVCHSSYTDYPWNSQNISLSVDIDGHMVAGSDDYVVDMLFNDFIKNTSDENLTKWEDINKSFINIMIALNPNGIK